MKKIKVMHVLCMSTYSGAENVAITLINSLKEQVDSVYVSPNGPIRNVVQQNKIRHYAIDRVSISHIKKAIKVIEPDIIHAHDFTAGVVCAIASGSIPVINHLHNNSPWIKKFTLKSVIYGLTCFNYMRILTVSDSVMDEFIFGKIFKNKTVVVGNPINLDIIRRKAKEEISNVAPEDIKSDIIFLGRLTTAKNIFLFLDIINEVKKSIVNLKVSVVGDGELRNVFEEKIISYNLQDCIHLYGFQENPYPFLKSSKVMCMPSAWEGFGLAAVEGLALGKPVVASPVGGLVNIVDDNCGKLCVDLADYKKEICKLLTNQKYYNNKSKEAMIKSNMFDNYKKYAETIGTIYNKVTGVK